MPKNSDTSRNLLDQDNLCEIIYHILWNKDMFYPSSSLPVFVPDTVIFRSGTPIAWYFSDSEGVMKRKLEANLNIPNIVETFIKKKSKYGIVAYYIYMPESQNKDDPSDNEDDQKNIIEYYDEEAFRRLLSNPAKLKRGILQRFIDPQGERNSLIQCVWTKRICLFNRRTNNRLLKDANSNIYEKCVTFEGPPHLSESSALKGTALSVKVKEGLDFIVNHISNSTFEKFQVSKLVCYLKVDQHNRLWYLFSGFLRSKNRVLYAAVKGENDGQGGTEPLNLNDQIKIPENIYVGPKLATNSQQVQEKLESCPKCNKISSSSNFAEISYKDIMEAAGKPGPHKDITEEFDCTPNVELLLPPQGSQDARDDGQKMYRVRTKQASIPYIIRKLHPKLKPHEFEKIKNEDYFKSKKARICYNCYFSLSNTLDMGGNDQSSYNGREKSQSIKPKGQILSLNAKLKTANQTNASNENFSGSLSQRVFNRNNSMGSLNINELVTGTKRDRTKFLPNHGSLNNYTHLSSTGLLKRTDKEDVIQHDLYKPPLSDTKRYQNDNIVSGTKSGEDWASEANIFDTKESGKVIKLNYLPRPRTQSLPKVKSASVSSHSRKSSISKQQNHGGALLSLIQASQDIESAFPMAFLYPEREKTMLSESINPSAMFQGQNTSDRPYITHVSHLNSYHYYPNPAPDYRGPSIYSGKEDHPFIQKEKLPYSSGQYPELHDKIMTSQASEISTDHNLCSQGNMSERKIHNNLNRNSPQKYAENKGESNYTNLSKHNPSIFINSKSHQKKETSISARKAEKSTFDQSSQAVKAFVKQYVEKSPYGQGSSPTKRELAIKKFLQEPNNDIKTEPKGLKSLKVVKVAEEKLKAKLNQPLDTGFGILLGDAQGNWFVNPSQGSQVLEVDMQSIVDSVRDSYKSSLAPSETYDCRKEALVKFGGVQEDKTKTIDSLQDNLPKKEQQGENTAYNSSDHTHVNDSPRTSDLPYQLRLSKINSKKSLGSGEDNKPEDKLVTDLEYSHSQANRPSKQLKESSSTDYLQKDLTKYDLYTDQNSLPNLYTEQDQKAEKNIYNKDNVIAKANIVDDQEGLHLESSDESCNKIPIVDQEQMVENTNK